MKDESLLKLAMSLHANPGVYALLIGSGVSKGANIPTGWDIILDLIKKVASIQGEKPPPNPEVWYKKKFGEYPTYSKLIDKLTTTSDERMTLLRPYFEPTEEEKGFKIPTAAHLAIAKLVKMNYIRMILTTNFDRLIEKALETEDITPDIISSDDDLKGAIPYIHSRCMIAKLHGDYRDTRIKNTPEELESYSSELNQFLDRIFDEFGLIICGWSGEWDIALRNALCRSPSRRFTTFWLTRGELNDEAKKIVQHRRAENIRITSADEFFTYLLETIKSLKELEHFHPLTTEIAVATVKRYLSENYGIRLHDFIHEEASRVYQELKSDRFSTQIKDFTKEIFVERMHQYENLVERLIAMVTALSYYGTKENNHILTQCIELLAHPPRHDGRIALINLQLYPALLLLYSTGISALTAKRYDNLAAILNRPKCYDNSREQKIPAIKRLNVSSVFGEACKLVPLPNAEHKFTPASDYLFELLHQYLQYYIPENSKYEETFDVFEFWIALSYLDLTNDSWAPIGRYIWRYRDLFEKMDEKRLRNSPFGELITFEWREEIWFKFIREGFFDENYIKWQDAAKSYKSILQDRVKRLM